MNQTRLTFKRYEQKYLLSAEQFTDFRQQLDEYIQPDEYFRSTVCSVYYDTDNFSLIRSSIDGAVYREKLRLRSYGVPASDSTVYVELKEKFRGLVYKRRIAMKEAEAVDYLAGKIPLKEDSQPGREIDWFLASNTVHPKVFLAGDREAYEGRKDKELRITFDRNIRWRRDELDLTAGSHGEAVTNPGQVLMEIKMPESSPIWLARMLSENGIFPMGFSKYGTCYKENLFYEVVSDV